MLPPDIPYFTDWMMVRFTTISGNNPSQTSWGSVGKKGPFRARKHGFPGRGFWWPLLTTHHKTGLVKLQIKACIWTLLDRPILTHHPFIFLLIIFFLKACNTIPILVPYLCCWMTTSSFLHFIFSRSLHHLDVHLPLRQTFRQVLLQGVRFHMLFGLVQERRADLTMATNLSVP